MKRKRRGGSSREEQSGGESGRRRRFEPDTGMSFAEMSESADSDSTRKRGGRVRFSRKNL